MLTIAKASHLDHALTKAQIAYIRATFADRTGFFIETITLPAALGQVPCNLYGPAMGDAPVAENGSADLPPVMYRKRGDRPYTSRMLVKPSRMVSQVTVIAGPHDGAPCVLYTAFGGPLAPKEPADPTLKDSDRDASVAFWNAHALTTGSYALG